MLNPEKKPSCKNIYSQITFPGKNAYAAKSLGGGKHLIKNSASLPPRQFSKIHKHTHKQSTQTQTEMRIPNSKVTTVHESPITIEY